MSTLCPGFIDAHTHLTVGVKSYNEFFIDRFRQHVAEKAYQAAVHARVTLEGASPLCAMWDACIPTALSM